MINILFVHQSAELYGSDRTLLLLLKNLDRNKFFPVVILPKDGALKSAIEKEKIVIEIAPVLKLSRNMFTIKNMFNFIKDKKRAISVLDRLHEKYRFDIVYSNTLAVLLGQIYSNKRGIKHLWHVHEIIVHPKLIASIFPKLLHKYADIVVCNSIATRKNLTDRNQKLSNKTITIYNGIELIPNQIISSSKNDFGFANSDIVITLVGRISRLKGHKWLLDTFISYFNEFKNIKILFVGSPVVGQEFYLDQINNIIQTNNISDRITILGFSDELYKIWNITDIAIMPSTEAESFGLVAAEAMLAKKPVIASNHGGLTEIIVDHKTGFLVEPNNKVGLAEAIKKLIENPELRKSFGENGYNRVLETFSLQNHVDHFEKIFSELIPNKGN